MRFISAMIILAILAGGFRSARAADADTDAVTFAETRALLDRYCFMCHEGVTAQAGLTLDLYRPEDAPRQDRSIWKKVLTYVDADIMPPPDEEQPTAEERALIVRWIQDVALKVDCSAPAYPGRVTVRRLNRTEYGYTIQDLFGIELPVHEWLPTDDVGYGFDHIGDVLSIPPALFERYVEVADRVVRKAILVADEEQAPVRSRPGRTLGSNGEVREEFEFPYPGEYILRVVASADQAGPDPARMGLRWRREQLGEFDVLGKSGEQGTYEVTIVVEQPGNYRVGASFLNDYYRPDDPDPALRGDRNLHVHRLEVIGPIGSLPDILPESHQRIITVVPGSEADREEQLRCAREVLQHFVNRAWRRPVVSSEVDRLLKLFEMVLEDGGTYERGIQFAVQGALVSPNFLFRIEQDPDASDPAGVRNLGDHELAVRLSYFLWRSLPDDELRQLADAGLLREEAHLEAQVNRMLRDPRAERMTRDFAEQWLQLRLLETVSPDSRRYSTFNNNLRQAMMEETQMFFAHVVRENRPITELLSAEYTFVNEQLAQHYGIEGITGPEFRMVAVDPTQRGGLLGHAGILTITSNPTRTSPVKRGKWILENLLDAPPPAAPPNVPPLEAAQVDRGATLRERMEVHRRDPACAACHQLMDPLGFGLENYDPIGAWRTETRGIPVDAGGTLPDGRNFEGPAELRTILLERSDEFRNCLATKLLTYALGRGLEYYDECTLQEITSRMVREGDQFSSAIRGIVLSRPFRMQARQRFPD